MFLCSLDWHLLNRMLFLAFSGQVGTLSTGVTSDQVDTAYSTWLQGMYYFCINAGQKSIADDRISAAGSSGGLAGMNQYQASDCFYGAFRR
jgi:hypothetical protein